MVSKKSVGFVLVVGLIVISYFSVIRSRKSDVLIIGEAEATSPSIWLEEATNSDGSLKIVGKRKTVGENIGYSFNILDNQNNTNLLLFETVADIGQTFAIPSNSWSSDNKYLFIQKNYLGGKDYYVFKADGSSFGDSKKFLEVGEYWRQSGNKEIIDHVSGWAGADLLVAYTTEPDGTGSKAYWFVIGSRKFMQVREL
ncbi:MAG: hypothetical protein AAB966_03320 [Patescibacteria group bacterium]